MTKLKELERRLRDEPDNLGLRVSVAGALHEAGRRADAVELYRSVAIAYRDQGRLQQAIAVCRSVLELAPGDASCRELLEALLASPAPRASPPPAPRASPAPQPSPPWLARPRSPDPEDAEPARRSSGDVTPLPRPLSYHEADPTTGSVLRLSPSDLPPSLQQELASYPEIAGIAAAARQISASLIAATRREAELEELADEELAAELDTGRVLRTGGPPRVSSTRPPRRPPPPRPPTPRPPTPPPTLSPDTDTIELPAGAGASSDDDEPTLPPPPEVPGLAVIEDEKTLPRELPARGRPPSIAPPTAVTGPLAGAFFAPLPPRNRAAVLQRFRRRIAPIGTLVIRRGDTGHGLVVVVRGRLDLHADRADGARVALGAIGPGEYVGEASLLAGAPAAASAVAGVDSELLVLPADDFHDLTSSFPALRTELASVAERRARDHGQRLRG
jgi:hypothetical protein